MTNLTFGQSIGVEALPSQSALGTISRETRAHLWGIIHLWLESQSFNPQYEQVKAAFTDAALSECPGAAHHLSESASEMTSGKWGSAVHEAISAVESAARKACNDDKVDLASAVRKLRKEGQIAHPALGEMVIKFYAYGSDESGARHSLDAAATQNISENEAATIFGTAAALVSYFLRLANPQTPDPA